MAKILLIDDEYEILELAKLRLRSEGFEVVTAANGQEGLEKVRTEKPNLVLMDLIMPVMDGYGFLKELRKEKSAAELPVIVFTAKGNEEEVRVVLTLGATDYIRKPFVPSMLIGKIQKALGRS